MYHSLVVVDKHVEAPSRLMGLIDRFFERGSYAQAIGLTLYFSTAPNNVLPGELD